MSSKINEGTYSILDGWIGGESREQASLDSREYVMAILSASGVKDARLEGYC